MIRCAPLSVGDPAVEGQGINCMKRKKESSDFEQCKNRNIERRGLLDISTARYFYKVPKTLLHKPTANSGINIFFNKCLYK
jgi:hypothetical protein